MRVRTLNKKALQEMDEAAKGVYALPRQLSEQDKQKTKEAIRAIKEGKYSDLDSKYKD